VNVEVAQLPWRRAFGILSKHKGHALIMEGYQRHARLEMWAGGTQVLAYATEALILAGRWSDAQRQVDEALSLAHRIDERSFVPDLLLLQARIALAVDQPDAANQAIRDSLARARAMQGHWQELATLVALCGMKEAGTEDFKRLENSYSRLSQGRDGALAGKARELI
jgi:hypothetical protein